MRAMACFRSSLIGFCPISLPTTNVASSVSAVPPATAEMMNITGSEGLNQMARPESTP